MNNKQALANIISFPSKERTELDRFIDTDPSRFFLVYDSQPWHLVRQTPVSQRGFYFLKEPVKALKAAFSQTASCQAFFMCSPLQEPAYEYAGLNIFISNMNHYFETHAILTGTPKLKAEIVRHPYFGLDVINMPIEGAKILRGFDSQTFPFNENFGIEQTDNVVSFDALG